MSVLRPAARPGEPGATRACPHCKASILESASVCPACRGHLRFDAAPGNVPLDTPLTVEGTIRHPPDGEPWEYSVVISVKNERGDQVARHVVGVGALHPHESRTFSLSVDVSKSTRMRAR